jgi:hypothetical protein
MIIGTDLKIMAQKSHAHWLAHPMKLELDRQLGIQSNTVTANKLPRKICQGKLSTTQQ